MKRASPPSHLGGDLFEDGPELDAFTLRRTNVQGLHQGRARAHQGRKLVKERQGVFEFGPRLALFDTAWATTIFRTPMFTSLVHANKSGRRRLVNDS